MSCSFLFNDTATTEIYTLSLHDALPILGEVCRIPVRRRLAARDEGGERGLHERPGALEGARIAVGEADPVAAEGEDERQDRKSTRLNSSHANISYAVFCLQKKNSPVQAH